VKIGVNLKNWYGSSLMEKIYRFQLRFQRSKELQRNGEAKKRRGENWWVKTGVGENWGHTILVIGKENWGHTILVIGLANWESMTDF
jgi:hypothetical protein